MKRSLILLLAWPLFAGAVGAFHSLPDLERQAQQFAEASQAGTGATFSYGQIDRKLQLKSCPQTPIPSWMANKMQGNTAVDLACPPLGWRARVPVKVSYETRVVVLRRPVMAGTTLTADDVTLAPMQAGTLGSFLQNTADVIGKSVHQGLPAGMPLRRTQVAFPLLVKSGQKVQIIASDGSFLVSSEATATRSAAEGDVLPVRLPNGRVVSGVVNTTGDVIVRF